MSMWTDMMAAETAMRDATKLIEEQRAAIAECCRCMVYLLDTIHNLTQFDYELDAVLNASELIAKHAPAQSQEPK